MLKKTIGNLLFIAESKDNKNGFVHQVKVYNQAGDFLICKTNTQYYNKTWEAWQFQRALKRTVEYMNKKQLLSNEYNELIKEQFNF